MKRHTAIGFAFSMRALRIGNSPHAKGHYAIAYLQRFTDKELQARN